MNTLQSHSHVLQKFKHFQLDSLERLSNQSWCYSIVNCNSSLHHLNIIIVIIFLCTLWTHLESFHLLYFPFGVKSDIKSSLCSTGEPVPTLLGGHLSFAASFQPPVFDGHFCLMASGHT